ncbi:MAG: M48 family metallopeptidase [Nanoarchaeales archaeon]|nr:M48 family metallopeptidase [Nanoarchaeales archaeon]
MFFKKIQERPQFQNEIQLNEQTFEIIVQFTKKKNSSVTVSNTIINFRFPNHLSNRQAEQHFIELLNKIKIKILKSPRIQNQSNHLTFKEIYQLEKFKFHNSTYTIEKSSIQGVKLDEFHFRINKNLTMLQIEKLVIKRLVEKYTPILNNHLLSLNEVTYNYKITGFSISMVKSKWGHCTHDNKIMLNLKLLNAEIDILNYVIFHEISHINQKNHKPKFWNVVEQFCPNHKQLRKTLKNNPPTLFLKAD